MRNHLLPSILFFAAALFSSSGMRAQTAPKKAAMAKSEAASKPVPKMADGTPDFSGVWEGHMPASARKWASYSFTGDIPEMTPFGKAIYEKTKPSWGPRAVVDSTDMVNPTTGNEIGCFPTGVPRIYVHPFPMEILQVPGRVVQLFEFNHFVRQIYTTGAHEHAKDLDPSWMGDSVGWWEGDTLVVDSVAFNDKTWLDRAGLPHSDQLHVVEHISRPNFKTLVVHITVDDPKAYTKTWEGERIYELEPDWKLTEMICEDNITFNDLKKAGKEQ
ncbi:MAG TPA: hypothetical protein VHS29_12900 [Candidatus Acidoferrales bacterium]|jgi:hypothetical protein|nr:hypothetical protein [Candidatus Acidoferrales bacterium]